MEVSKDDVKGIVEAIKRFLPDFSVTKEDFLKIRPSFVIAFCHRYLNELAKNCQMLFECGTEFEDILEIRPIDIEPEMFLFLQMRNILNKIGVPYFTLCDFYRPSNRTRLTIKVCLNFLLYIKENLPKAQSLIQDFNTKVRYQQLIMEKIVKDKNDIRDLACKIGLYQEKLCELEKDYDTEKKLQTTPLDTKLELDNEIEEHEKELEEIKIHVDSQEHSNTVLDTEVKELSDQVVSDHYESQKETLEQLKARIEQDKFAIVQSEKTLARKHKELEYINGHIMYLEKCNTSPLDFIERIDYSKQKVKEMESVRDKNESSLNEKFVYLKEINENIVKITKDNEKYINNLESTLLGMNNKYNECIKQLELAKKLYIDLLNKSANLRKQIQDSEEMCAKIEEENVFIQNKLQGICEKMLFSQNLIITSFNKIQ